MANKTARQKKLGPAPFASFEDLSEDLSSPESKGYQPMPEICEEHLQQHRTTYGGDNNDASASTSTAQTPTTPRIDVEQASSPSQAESGDSTPERELFDLDTATSDNLTSAFLEGAADVDLRSSAEDMGIPYSSTGSFKGRHSRNSSLLATGKSAPGSRKISWDAGDNRKRQVGDGHYQLERKGSGGRSGNNSDPVFFPSRDTRLSSISSNVSATSGMSALSAFSAGRRSPSPHRMQLETSFCGPKTVAAAAAKEAEEEEELLDLEASRRPSLLNPPTWFGDAGSRCASPLGTPSSPGCMRAFMFKYATEPRSRPTSPMGWHSAAPSPGPSLNVTATGDVSTRWLASPRCQRRSSSPHRTLVETSFCGHMQIKVPEDEVAPRGPSPMPSIGSLLSIQSQPVKYATEPRSRPASPTASRSYFNLTPVPVDSRRGSQSGRCPSPMIETSFCGPKQLTRRDSQEDAIISVSNCQRPSQSCAGQNESANLRPVRYQTEPRSRPVSPNPQPQQQQPTIADSPHINRPARSPSPHMMRLETSFCGAKQVARQDSGQHKSIIVQQPSRDMENVTEVSIHPLPVKYATEPRSRPVSPCSLLSNHCPATPDRERRRSPSPHRMVVETSFYSSKLPVEKECPAGHPLELVVAPGEMASQINQPSTPVKYATEPRSRPVSPSVNLLSNHSTPEAGRRLRSPSPHRMLVETSFCGNKQVARQESQVEQAVIQLVEKSRLDDQEPGNLSNSSSSIAEMPAVANHLDEKTSSSLSSLTGVVVQDEHQQAIDGFPTNWPDQPVSQFAAVWPVQHLTTFELSDRKSSQGDLRSSSEETASPPSQHSNGHMVPAAKPVSSPNRPGRQLPKPVACPKPPQSFAPQYDSSAPSSPLASSPALSRRLESASPSPSSPFPSRRTSLGGALRQNNQATAEEAASESRDRKSSVTTTKSGDLSDENPQYPDTSSKTDKKGRSVLSVLFGKRTGKNKNKDQEQMDELRNGQQLEAGNRMLSLPLSSRDNSPGRSIGDSCQSGDDLDDGVGFQHQVLETGNDSCDNLVETELDSKVAPVQQPPKEEMGLFHQDSIEEELPFVPTTLPIERPIAPLITPVRMRVSEVKTTATVRPRCSISFTPRSIDDYVKIARTDSLGGSQQDPVAVLQIPKIKVSLPKSEREESFDLDPSTVGAMPSVPPIKVTAGVVCSNWEAFSEQVFLRSGSRKRANKEPDTENEGVVRTESKADRTTTIKSSPGSTNSQWINVEELPEPVKEAKAIKVVTAGRDATKVGAVATPAAQVELLEDLDGEKSNLELPVRKDSVSSETALLREIDEADLEEDRSPPALLDEDDPSISIRERHSQSSSLAELDSNMDDVETVALARPNLLDVAPFGMDLDVHSNRSSVIAPSEIPSPDELSISTQ